MTNDIVISPDDASYFLNLAVIAGTLIGLAFIALGVFMVELLKRYDNTALPVFRDRETNDSARRSSHLNPLFALTDRELVDGDPFAVYMSYSVAVAWSLFLLPLLVGLTAAWGEVRLWILAVEMAIFVATFAWNFRWRSKKIDAIRPYRTGEELLWPIFGYVALGLYGITTVVLLISVLAEQNLSGATYFELWHHYGVSNNLASIFCLKLSCVIALLFGTYNVNKDMFIFFKCLSSERMRNCWLTSFVEQTYPQLRERVERTIAHLPASVQASDHLAQEWKRGPNLIPTHDALASAGTSSIESIWRQILNRESGAPSWMLDVPSIANWAALIEHLLQAREAKGHHDLAVEAIRIEDATDKL